MRANSVCRVNLCTEFSIIKKEATAKCRSFFEFYGFVYATVSEIKSAS